MLEMWGGRSWPVVVGAGAYLAGMTGVTAAFNVPLNARLDRAGESTAEADAAWRHYTTVWTRWNHVRTMASIMASALFTLALIRHG
ncbi:DUF1772 domain-containing protein [Leptolyngbya sp. 15MV]|nr:DUF1772 domain-containing protein [Leptolyngbya sp. 15MV]